MIPYLLRSFPRYGSLLRYYDLTAVSYSEDSRSAFDATQHSCDKIKNDNRGNPASNTLLFIRQE